MKLFHHAPTLALMIFLTSACCAHCRTAKFIGDRRADVAIRSFGRPYNKIVIAESGPLT